MCLRGADLGGVVRLGRQVVAEKRCLGSEPVTGELHAVAGVPGETDDDLFEALTGRSVGEAPYESDAAPLPFGSTSSPSICLRTDTPPTSQVTRRRSGCRALALVCHWRYQLWHFFEGCTAVPYVCRAAVLPAKPEVSGGLLASTNQTVLLVTSCALATVVHTVPVSGGRDSGPGFCRRRFRLAIRYRARQRRMAEPASGGGPGRAQDAGGRRRSGCRR